MSTVAQRAKLSLAASYPELAMDPLTHDPRIAPIGDDVVYNLPLIPKLDTVESQPQEQLNSFDSVSPSSWSWPVVQLLLDSRPEFEFSRNSLIGIESLPSRDIAHYLCKSALEDGCCLTRLVHEPTFYSMLNYIYDTHPSQYTAEEKSFVCLLFLVMSVGCLFSSGRVGSFDLSCYESSITQGYAYPSGHVRHFEVHRRLTWS